MTKPTRKPHGSKLSISINAGINAFWQKRGIVQPGVRQLAAQMNASSFHAAAKTRRYSEALQ